MGPVVWNALFGDIWSFLSTNNLLEVDSLMGPRVALYRLLRPLAQLLIARSHRPRTRKSP
jgi:hypothetical protein